MSVYACHCTPAHSSRIAGHMRDSISVMTPIKQHEAIATYSRCVHKHSGLLLVVCVVFSMYEHVLVV